VVFRETFILHTYIRHFILLFPEEFVDCFFSSVSVGRGVGASFLSSRIREATPVLGLLLSSVN
jgi:hypothetical protein